MKYRYRNRKTGEEITTSNRVSGKNWEPVEDTPVLPPEDNFGEAAMAEEETMEEPVEAPVEKSAEAPVEKPAAKSSRKGKK